MRIASRPLALWISTTATFSSAAITLPAAAAFRGVHQYNKKNNKYQTRKQNNSQTHNNSRSYSSSFLRRKMSSSSSNINNAEDDSKVRVALCQFRVGNDKPKNHKTALDYIERASKQGAELVVLPEIWNSPYATTAFPDYAEVLPSVGDPFDDDGDDSDDDDNASSSSSPTSNLLRTCAKKHSVWIVGGSIPEKKEEDDKIYNTCLVINPDGEIVAKHSKVHLFDIDVPGKITFFESDTLSAGNQLTSFQTPQWGTIGIGICYDIRFPEYAMLLCQQASSSGKSSPLTMLIYPGAFNLTTGPAHWELLQRARALDNQCFVLTASPARTTEEEASAESSKDDKEKKYPHYTAWGHSTVVSPWGDVVATTDEKESLVVVDIDLSKVGDIRKSIPIIQQKRHDLYKLEGK